MPALITKGRLYFSKVRNEMQVIFLNNNKEYLFLTDKFIIVFFLYKTLKNQ